MRREDLDLARQPQHLPHRRAQEETQRGNRAALNGHQPLHRHRRRHKANPATLPPHQQTRRGRSSHHFALVRKYELRRNRANHWHLHEERLRQIGQNQGTTEENVKRLKRKAMENNELEEMRAQLATLNEKLENESIVDERLVSEATKKHISELQRKLIGRIVIITLWAAYFYWRLELGIFLLWCVGLLVISIYTCFVVRQGNSASMPVTEYARRLRKALKIYKIGNRFLWILTILLIMAWATYVLVLNWPSNLKIVLPIFFVCSMIALILLVAYFIKNVYVSPDVELKLEMVLEDLDKDNQDAE